MVVIPDNSKFQNLKVVGNDFAMKESSDSTFQAV